MIIAIDPGTTESGVVMWDGEKVRRREILPNVNLVEILPVINYAQNTLVIEQFRCYGMAVGESTIDAIFWSGRFAQAWGREFHLLPRMDVKMHLCGRANATDANVNQALRDRFGEKGTKKNPGTLYGISKHMWAALALAVTFYDKTHPNEGPRIPAGEREGA